MLTTHYKGSVYREYLRHVYGYDSDKWKRYFEHIENMAILRSDKISFPSKSSLESPY